MLLEQDKILENKLIEDMNIGDYAEDIKLITQEDLNVFSFVSKDMNPTHFDKEYIEEHGLKDITAHSMLSGSFFSSILGNKLPGPGTVYLEQNLKFHDALYVGEKIKIKVTIVSKIKKNQEDIVVFDCEIINLENNKLIVSGTAIVKAPTKKIKYHLENQLNLTLVDKHAKHQELINKAKKFNKAKMAIVYPCDEPSLGGVIGSYEEGLIEPILIGPKVKIVKIAQKLNKNISDYEIIDIESEVEAAEYAVKLAKEKKVNAIMKGSLHTDELMAAVVNKTNGIRTKTRISHVFYMDVPRYKKPLLITDAAINIAPDLEAKVDILKNSIQLAKSLEIETPKVAILAAVETINTKMIPTLDAAAICKMADRGQIKGAIVDGPLAFDNAISAEAAKTKGIKSEVSGDADILLVPDLEAGNILAKQLEYLADGVSAGIVLGAQAPIALTSRADKQSVRIASAALCVILANYLKNQD